MIYASGVKHVARFWLRTPADRSAIMAGIGRLADIPEVLDLIVGPPLDSDWGRRIDKSWDVGFIASFASLADCRAYFECDRHQRVAGELQELAERVEAFYIEY
jgi:hypothetical protein